MQELHGMLFPDDVEVPEQHFYRIDFGSDMMWDLNGDGYVDLAHQRDVESLETEVIDTGTDSDGIQYAVCQTRAVFPDGTFMAVSGADETSQQVRRPEFVWSVAGTRSLKRAIGRALNIQDAESPDEAPDSRTDRDRSATTNPKPSPAADRGGETPSPDTGTGADW